MYRVALVCEGPADRAILEAILDHYLDDYEPISIQPPTGVLGGEAGPLGGGWKGVRTWCRQEDPSTVDADLLVVQVDADVALDADNDCARPCPPPAGTADAVRALVQGWLGPAPLPDKLLLCVPSMASETWALVALFPGHGAVVPCHPRPPDGTCVECRDDVKALLRKAGRGLRPKLVVSQGGELKNQARGYRAVQERIEKGWPQVVATCGEASRFDTALRAVLP